MIKNKEDHINKEDKYNSIRDMPFKKKITEAKWDFKIHSGKEEKNFRNNCYCLSQKFESIH